MIAMIAWGSVPAEFAPAEFAPADVTVDNNLSAENRSSGRKATIASDDENIRMNRQWIEDAISPRPRIYFQMRIQQRIRIRIPRRAPPSGRQKRTPDPQANPDKWETRKIGKCVPMNGIEGVQISAKQNRLLFYMRDRSIIRAELEKNCPARSFYSGFYLEQSADGQLCVERDFLLARSGQQCQLDKIRQLVPDD